VERNGSPAVRIHKHTAAEAVEISGGEKMPHQTKPEDKPAAVRFHIFDMDGGLEVSCALLPMKKTPPYRIEGGAPRFGSRDAFKAEVVEAGMSPAVAEDERRSFNATPRQLRKLGFVVETEEEKREEEPIAA
jgi:hypothetical protein